MNMIEVLDPAGQVQKIVGLQGNPVASLEGARLAILDNAKPNFRELAGRVGEKLQVDCALQSVSFFRKENPTVGASPELLDEIAGAADLVLTGSAD